MLGGHYFRRIRHRRRLHAAAVRPTNEPLASLLSHQVIDRFARISKAGVTATPLSLPDPGTADELPANPCHPACAEYAESDYCRESWQLHLAELRQRPETHWHKCDHGRRCAIVPVVYRAQCLAAVKLACPASMAEKDFERLVELLDVLVNDFVTAQADALSRFLLTRQVDTDAGGSAPPDIPAHLDQQLSSPHVLRAVQYIEEHLSEPKLTVGCVARELDIDSSYLGRLFADQVGQRMNWFIAARRVELAKTLLATTDRQIKRIARDTGHANPNWFCHVFSAHTGLTPGQYRRRSRHS